MNLFTKILARVKEWKEELWSIPVALLLFLYSPNILRWFDPTAGAYDAGLLQVILFAIVAFLIFHALAWVGVKLVFREIFDFFQTGFAKAFNDLDSWQKVKVSLSVFFVFLLSLVLLAKVL